MTSNNHSGDVRSGVSEALQLGQAEIAGRNREPVTPPLVGIGNVQPIYTGKDSYPSAPGSQK